MDRWFDIYYTLIIMENIDFFDQEPPTSASLGKYLLYIFIGLCLVVVGLLSIHVWKVAHADPIYSTVFLQNGQTYFGRIQREDKNYIVLANAHYLQTTQREERDSKGRVVNVPTISAVRVGTEAHAPKSTIRISRSQVLVIEELEPTSQFINLIQQAPK